MWPDARLKDKEMFTHLNVEFDLNSNKITAETAAKDYHGVPHYQYIYNTNEHTAVEITNLGEEDFADVVNVPAFTATEVPTAVEDISAFAPEVVSEIGGIPLSEEMKILSLEEQREVAFKVVSFFIMLIIASFALMFIYHRCS